MPWDSDTDRRVFVSGLAKVAGDIVCAGFASGDVTAAGVEDAYRSVLDGVTQHTLAVIDELEAEGRFGGAAPAAPAPAQPQVAPAQPFNPAPPTPPLTQPAAPPQQPPPPPPGPQAPPAAPPPPPGAQVAGQGDQTKMQAAQVLVSEHASNQYDQWGNLPSFYLNYDKQDGARRAAFQAAGRKGTVWEGTTLWLSGSKYDNDYDGLVQQYGLHVHPADRAAQAAQAVVQNTPGASWDTPRPGEEPF